MAASELEELLLGDLHATGVYDIAADLGIVQHGHLTHEGWMAPSGLSPLPPLPSGGLTPPDSSLLAAHPSLRQRPQLLPCVDPAAMHEADCAVVSCLEAADAAAVALRLSGLQLEQCSSQEPASNASAADYVDDNLASPQAAAAAAAMLDQLQGGHAAEAGAGGGAGGSTASGTPAPAGKRKRSTGKRASAAAAAAGKGGGEAEGSAAAAAGAGTAAAAAAARQPGPGKGLRHFSLKVCEKVESKGATTYEEVANELIADLAAEVAAGSLEQVHDEKNIRRRVYDALNVLEAIGMISKVKKAIQWLGWPEGLGRSTEDKQQAEKAKCLEQVDAKRQALQDATHKAYSLSNLILRNREAPLPLLEAMREADARVPNPLTLPFMLVQADQEAEVDVQFSKDNLNAHIDFQHWPFVLYDDDHVMRMLNLHTPQPELYANLPESGAHPPFQHQQQHQAAMQLAGMQQSLPQHQHQHQHQHQQHQHQGQSQNQRQIKREPGLRDAAPLQRQQQQQLQGQGQEGGMLGLPPPPFLQLQPREEDAQVQVHQVHYHQRQHQQPPLGMLLLQPPSPRHQPHQQQQQQQQQQYTCDVQLGSTARLTPNTRAGARLPTPNLQLSPELSSLSNPLDASVSAIELGSPPGSLARSAGGGGSGGAAAAAAAFGRVPSSRTQQQQQQQQQAVLRPSLLPPTAASPAGLPGASKAELLFGTAAPGLHTAGHLLPSGSGGGTGGGGGGGTAPLHNNCWSQYNAAPGGTTYMSAHSEPSQQTAPGMLAVPQLRPASADTVRLSLQQQQQQQQQQLEAAALGLVPMLRHLPQH